jgi:hypothetical protein
MAARLTRLTHKVAMKLHLLSESYLIYSSRSRWSVRKLLDTLYALGNAEVGPKYWPHSKCKVVRVLNKVPCHEDTLHLIKHHAMKTYGGVEVYLPCILNLGTRWRWVVSFTLRPLYSVERASGNHRIGGWVGPLEPEYRKIKSSSVSYRMGTGGSFLGVLRPGSEVDHSPPSSAEVKTAWSYTSTPITSSWRGD